MLSVTSLILGHEIVDGSGHELVKYMLDLADGEG
jgi:hypothetical protein